MKKFIEGGTMVTFIRQMLMEKEGIPLRWRSQLSGISGKELLLGPKLLYRMTRKGLEMELQHGTFQIFIPKGHPSLLFELHIKKLKWETEELRPLTEATLRDGIREMKRPKWKFRVFRLEDTEKQTNVPDVKEVRYRDIQDHYWEVRQEWSGHRFQPWKKVSDKDEKLRLIGVGESAYKLDLAATPLENAYLDASGFKIKENED